MEIFPIPSLIIFSYGYLKWDFLLKSWGAIAHIAAPQPPKEATVWYSIIVLSLSQKILHNQFCQSICIVKS